MWTCRSCLARRRGSISHCLSGFWCRLIRLQPAKGDHARAFWHTQRWSTWLHTKKDKAVEAPLPAGDKVWWYKEQLGIRIPFAITADTVAYYSELAGKYGKQALNRYMQPSSRLDYHAGVKFHKEYKLDDKTFNDVHVVTLKLILSQNFVATQIAGMQFEKERVVILDAKGKVLHISGDGPTEVPVLEI